MKALVLTLRGCHVGYLGCCGNGWIATPVLDRLAARGVVFDQHFADVPEAAAARRAWRDGCHHFPGGEDASTFDLVAALRAAGVTTVLVADGSRPFPAGFAEGWDECEIVRGEGPPLERTLETAREALEQLAPQDRWLLWVDLATLLPPWEAPPDFCDHYFRDEEERYEPVEREEDPDDEGEEEPPREEEVEGEDPLTPWNDPPVGPINTDDDIDFCRLQSTYAGPMSYLDAGLGVLFEELERHGLADECLVLATPDHGQALGEHGFVGPYRPWLHDELLHLPLLLRLPGGASAGHRVSALTQSVDIAPTLLAAFGVAPPPTLHGLDLLPLARQEAGATRTHACAALRMGEAVGGCIRTAEWALLLPLHPHPDDLSRLPSLHVKPDDRWEVNDVAQHHPDLAQELERLLRENLSSPRRMTP
jgi:arylsulfatase A-like enzyme